jgi:hypothetical protein
MIQRFTVHFEGSDHVPSVIEGLAELGFPDNAIRVWHEPNSNFVNAHAYRDGDLDTMPRLDLALMEDHCVYIWSRIGYAKITLSEFAATDSIVEFANDQYFEWDTG